jgi:hypothetical protein
MKNKKHNKIKMTENASTRLPAFAKPPNSEGMEPDIALAVNDSRSGR